MCRGTQVFRESGRGEPRPNVGNQKFSMRNVNEVCNCHLKRLILEIQPRHTSRLHHNIIIWSLNRSSVIIFDALFRLSLHGRCLSSFDRHELLVLQSRSTIIAQHRPYAAFKVQQDMTRHCFWATVNCIWSQRQVTILFPKLKCIWQKQGQKAILSPTGFLWPYRLQRSYTWLTVKVKLAKTAI